MKTDNKNISELTMLESIRKRFMFVEIETQKNGLKALIIPRTGGRIIAEFNPSDTQRLSELIRLYGVNK